METDNHSCGKRLALSLTLILAIDWPCTNAHAQTAQYLDKLRREREIAFKITWAGRTYDDLVQVFGQPRQTLYIPGDLTGGQKHVAFFGLNDPQSGCLDAFTIQPDDGGNMIVIEYFCR